jgi:predicted acetyltransferase
LPAELPVRPIAPEELAAFTDTGERAFGDDTSQEGYLDRERSVFEFDRSLAAFDGTQVVATSSAFSVSLRVPGGELRAPVITWVAVAAGYRRRGLLTRMMRGLLDGARERGEPVTALFASESSIYGRYGYGVASRESYLRLDRRAAAFRPDAPQPGLVRAVDLAGARGLFPQVYEQAREQYTGMPSRSGAWWDYSVLADPPSRREGAGAKQFAVHERSGGGLDGYAVWRLKSGWNDGLADGTVEVVELMATSPEALAGLWRYCLDIDLSERVVASRRPLDEPLAHLLADPRRLRATLRDGLWLRFVDLAGALEARSWAGSDRLTLGVRDPFQSDQGGVWSLEVEQGSAVCRRTTAEPDLELDTESVASLYLGDARLPGLRAAGRVRERTQGAAARLGVLLASPALPWAPEEF